MNFIVVTGASTGIGRATALSLVAKGHTVFAGVRKATDGDVLAQAAASERLVPLLLEVTDEAQVAAAFDRVRTHLAGSPLTGLVNNAGIGVGGPVEFLALSEWRRQFEVNLFGQIAVTKCAIPLMRGQGRRRIVNVTSMGGRIAQPYMAPYSASKFALEAVTDALRIELRYWGIDVIAVEPGAIATPIWDKAKTELGAAGDVLPEEGRALYAHGMRAIARFVAVTSARGIPPERVANAIDHALHSRWPRARYSVGLDAKIGMFLHDWLPNRIWDRVLTLA